MKELSIEEKAKRYDEALKVAKGNYETIMQMDNDCTFSKEGIVNTFLRMFPELKESEDERIRNAIKLMYSFLPNNPEYIGSVHIKEIFAWLEKQCEQKPTDKVEPKFQNGQWIVWQNKCYKVNYNGCGYELVDQNGLSTSLEYGTVEESAHLWDITKDAKDGDVLANKYGDIMLFKGITNDRHICGYCQYSVEDRKLYNECSDFSNYYPATKEQRDFLFQKMKEAGYEWDAEKKELKKIEQKPAENNAKVSESSTEEKDMGEYKKGFECGKQRVLKYPEDFGLFKKHTWSKEDASLCARIQGILSVCKSHSLLSPDLYKEMCDWLKLLKDKVQPKQEWSEKDKSMMESILSKLYSDENVNSDEYYKYHHWFKSLKEKYTWKPSDEQMKRLKGTINSLPHQEVLYSLYQDLKKLRGE